MAFLDCRTGFICEQCRSEYAIVNYAIPETIAVDAQAQWNLCRDCVGSNTAEVQRMKIYQVDDDEPHICVGSVGDSPALKLADQLSMAQAEISRLRDGFMRLDTASDLQMRDGDLAREVAKEMLPKARWMR